MLQDINNIKTDSNRAISQINQELQEVVVVPSLVVPAEVQQSFDRRLGVIQSQDNPLTPLEQATHLPKSQPIISLCYLTTLKMNKERSPFDKESIDLFQKSKKYSAWALAELKWGPIPLFIPPILGGFATFLSLTSLSAVKLAGTVGTIGTITSYASNLLGLRITGTSPDRSQTAANDKDLALQLLAEYYHEMAIKLIDLSFKESQFAQTLVSNIPLDVIFELAKKDSGLQENEINLVLKQFRSAISYIKDGLEPTQTTLQQCIRLNQMESQLQLLMNPERV